MQIFTLKFNFSILITFIFTYSLNLFATDNLDINSGDNEIFILDFKSNNEDENIRITKANEVLLKIDGLNKEIATLKESFLLLWKKVELLEEDISVGEGDKDHLDELHKLSSKDFSIIMEKQAERIKLFDTYLKRLEFLKKSEDNIVKQISDKLSERAMNQKLNFEIHYKKGKKMLEEINKKIENSNPI